MGRRLILKRKLTCRGPALAAAFNEAVVLCCISSPFGELSTTRGKNDLQCYSPRAPLYRAEALSSCDLHVLGAPLTFVLSQNQTLQFEFFGERPEPEGTGTCHNARYHSFAQSLRRDEHDWCGDHAISRGVLGLSFQGPRGAGGSRQRGSRYLVPVVSDVQRFFRNLSTFLFVGVFPVKRSRAVRRSESSELPQGCLRSSWTGCRFRGPPRQPPQGAAVKGGRIWSIPRDQASSFDPLGSIFECYPQVVDKSGGFRRGRIGPRVPGKPRQASRTAALSINQAPRGSRTRKTSAPEARRAR